MATAFNAGTAYVSILPSLRGFPARLRTELSRVDETVQVRVEPDTSRLRSDLRAAVDAAVAGARVQIPVDLDVDVPALRAQLAGIGGVTVKVRLDPDIAALRALLQNLPPFDVRVDLEPDIAALQARLRGANLRADVDVDVDRSGSLGRALGSAGTLARNLGLATAAVSALGSGAVALAPLVSALIASAGAAGLIPAALAGAGASFAAIKIGLGGVGDTFKALTAAQEETATGAGQSAAAQEAAAKRVRDAARGVEDAQRQADRTAVDGARSVTDARRGVADAVTASNERVIAAEGRVQRAQETRRSAQEALTRAVQDAREAQEDLTLSLSGAALSEESAVLSLLRARERLAAMPADSTALDYREAELAVRQAEQAVKETAERHQDLQQESAKSAAAGISGADGVVAANGRLQAANRGVSDAEADLTKARTDGAVDVARANERVQLAQESAALANQDAARSVTQAQQQLAEAYQTTGDTGTASTSKVAAGLAKLAPQAREFVSAVQALKPAWDGLRLDVQQQLFAGLGASMTTLANAQLPGLRVGLAGIAAGFSAGARDAMAFLSSASAVGDVRGILDQTAVSSRLFAGTMTPLSKIFLDFSAVGAPIITELAGSFAAAAERAAAFIATARATGELEQWIRGGLAALSQLGQVLGNLAGSVGAVFQAMETAGTGSLDVLLQLTGQLRTFLESPVGQAGLVAFFTTLKDITTALLPGVLAILGAISQGLQILGPSLAPLAVLVSDILISLAPLIPLAAEIVAVFVDFAVQALRPLLPLLDTVVQVLSTVLLAALEALKPVFPVIIDLVQRLAPVFARLVEQVGTFFVAAVNAIAPLLPPLVEAFGRILDALLPILPPLIQFGVQLIEAITPILPELVGLFIRLVDAVLPLLPPLLRLAEALLPEVVAAVEFLLPILLELTRIFTDVLVWALDNVVVPAVNFLVDAFINVRKVWGEVGAWLDAKWLEFRIWAEYTFWSIKWTIDKVWDEIKTAIFTTWNDIKTWLDARWAEFTAGWNQFWQDVKNWLSTKWEEMKATVFDAWTQISTFFTTKLSEFTTSWNTTWQNIANFLRSEWEKIKTTVYDAWTALSTFLTSKLAELGVQWNATWQRVADWVYTKWEEIKGSLNSAWLWIKGTVWEPMINFVSRTIPDAFNVAVNGIRTAWDRIREIVADPIRFMVEVVYNQGIVRAWNAVAGLIGVPGIAEIRLPFKEGGRIPGSRDQAVPIDAHGNEHMWTAREVQGAGGHEAVEQLRMQALTPGRTFKDLQRGRLVEGADHDGGGYSRTGFGGVRPHVAQTGHYIRQKFGVRDIGGVGSRPGPSDHPAGLALDFMTYTNSAKGAAVARYMVENAAHMAVKYVIWQQRINSGSGWHGMPDRGSPTANHMDHPHVSFLADPRGGRGFTGGGDTGGGDSGGGFMSFVLDQVRNIYNGLTAPIPGAIAALVGNPPPEFRRIPPRMAEITIKSVGDFLFGKAAAADNAAGASGGSGAAGGSPAVTQAVDSVAKGYGWGIGTSQWSALSRLIQKESSWNPNAQNPRSTAYGLFQFLNSTWATVGGTKTSDPRMQAVHGLKYVQQRYRDPVGALSFHDRNNWYDQGGVASGRGIMLKKVLTPERVLSTRQNVGFEQLVAVVTGAYQQRQSPVLTGEQWRTRSGDTSTETTINVEVVNPVAERTSQTLSREMRTMSEMGMFG